MYCGLGAFVCLRLNKKDAMSLRALLVPHVQNGVNPPARALTCSVMGVFDAQLPVEVSTVLHVVTKILLPPSLSYHQNTPCLATIFTLNETKNAISTKLSAPHFIKY